MGGVTQEPAPAVAEVKGATPPPPKHRNEPRVFMFVGKTGYGKSTLAIRTVNDLLLANPTLKLLVVNPQATDERFGPVRVWRELPDDAFLASLRDTVVMIEEAAFYQNSHYIGQGLRSMLIDVRHRNLYLVTTSQRMSDHHPHFMTNVHVLHVFRLQAEADVHALRNYMSAEDRKRVSRLAEGEYFRLAL